MSELSIDNFDFMPSGYCMTRLGWDDLYAWQTLALDGIEKPGGRVALRTCNESGKTRRVIAGSILWHMETFKKSLTVVTSGSHLQLDGQLVPALKAAAADRGAGAFEWKKDRGVCVATGSEVRWFSTDDPGRAEGWHAGEISLSELGGDKELEEQLGSKVRTSLLIIIDEAKSVASGIWWAFERCHPTRLLVASSPGAPKGEFYDCFNAKKSRYLCVHASAKDCPHLWDVPSVRAELEEQVRTYPKQLTDSMVWGEFSTGGDHELFDAAAVSRAMSGINPRWGRGKIRVAIDLSAGGDGSPMYMCDGNEVRLVHEWHERDTMKLASSIVRELSRLQVRPEWVYADNGGLGLPIIDRLASLGWEINRVNFGGVPRKPRHFANVRSEMYTELASRVQCDELRLPADDAALKEQLLWQKYKPKDGPLQLISKASLPKSPDRADAVAMLFYDFPHASEYRSDLQVEELNPHTGKWVPFDGEETVGTGLWGD